MHLSPSFGSTMPSGPAVLPLSCIPMKWRSNSSFMRSEKGVILCIAVGPIAWCLAALMAFLANTTTRMPPPRRCPAASHSSGTPHPPIHCLVTWNIPVGSPLSPEEAKGSTHHRHKRGEGPRSLVPFCHGLLLPRVLLERGEMERGRQAVAAVHEVVAVVRLTSHGRGTMFDGAWEWWAATKIHSF